jgi:hypothetical protein
MHGSHGARAAGNVPRLATVALVVLALALTLGVAACGSRSGGHRSNSHTSGAAKKDGSTSGTGTPGTGTPGAGTSGASPTVRHVISSPARALLGHWKDNLGMDQYFNGKEWFTKSPSGDTWSYRYVVVSQDQAKQTVKTNTDLILAGQTLDQQEVTFTFTNHACTKLTWDMATSPTATYVDGETQP